MPVLEQFYDAAETMLEAHRRGHVDVTESTVRKAAYYGARPLKRTKIGARAFFARGDIEAWLESRIQRID
ncbi:DNA-binding protein [Mycolicibacterium rufum]|uniref:DNA-binding protein n=1 Tax=Mycolicibacterium rufum TaxID=318424 RepID=A0A9X2YBW6_9MYCO|nr:hypothetical protein [Mycolicibacterium rufum]KGI69593.1 hypothetical protein EU78_21545 [Mycolicibacterium rufum]MCV7070923.1 DNA-binding protein [Mycolicibacterium rufum]ULP35823.1 DNA-binding protein [Mycolicibacterium rufum]